MGQGIVGPLLLSRLKQGSLTVNKQQQQEVPSSRVKCNHARKQTTRH